ncbi:N-acetylmuramoyl-L-alanine amidase [Deinococcus apachensis]|uniref:N-acetylmuramoyl-L-alanine amidase n=1 Tax=Deinococcus apachensis TaxID=309886 RepID=UPI0003733154|nr:peptidoglycan recognition family protein [Deinococcus apachensis]
MKIEQVPAHSGNYTPGRQGTRVDRVVIHVADGTLRGTAAWFADPQCNVSAHFTVGTDGTVIQSVRESDTAWHSGEWAMNLRSVGIEHEGQPSKGPWTPSPAQLAASAELVAGLCQRYGIPADRVHLIAHSEVNPNRAARKNCPGPTWPWDAYIKAVQAVMAPAPAHQPDAQDARPVRLFNPETNTQIGVGTLISGTDKVYVTPDPLAALRK